VNAILPRAVKEAQQVIRKTCLRWRQKGKQWNKLYPANAKYCTNLNAYADKNLVDRATKSVNKKKTTSEADDLVDDHHDWEHDISTSELEQVVKSLNQTIFIMWCVIAALVILLLLSWAYIALTLFYFDDKKSGNRRRSIDLELGEGPRRSLNVPKSQRKSRRSSKSNRSRHHVSKSSVKPSRSSVRQSHLQIMVNSGRGNIRSSRSKVSQNSAAQSAESGRGPSSSRSRRLSNGDFAKTFLRQESNESQASGSKSSRGGRSSRRGGRSKRGDRSARGHRSSRSRQGPVSSRSRGH